MFLHIPKRYIKKCGTADSTKCIKARELQRQNDTSKDKESDSDNDIKVVAEKHGEMMRGTEGAVKEMVQKQAGRMRQVASFYYEDYVAGLIKKARKK